MHAPEKGATPPDWGLHPANACLHDAGLLWLSAVARAICSEQGRPTLRCACCLQGSFTGRTSS